MYSSVNTDKCWVVHCQGRLLMKAQNRDTDDPFCYVLDHISLKVGGTVYVLFTTSYMYHVSCNDRQGQRCAIGFMLMSPILPFI